MKKIWQQFVLYLLAMNASALDATITSASAFLGPAGAHALVDSIPALNLKQTGAIFALMMLRGIVAFVKANPVEKLFPSPIPGAPSVPASAPATTTAPEKQG